MLLFLVALVCGPVIWMFLQSPKTFISTYNGLVTGRKQCFSIRQPAHALRRLNVPSGEHSVVGEPSINAAAIDTILSQVWLAGSWNRPDLG